MQLNDTQLCEHCQCGHDRARHYGYTGQDGMCDRCYCPHFKPQTAQSVKAEVQPDLYQRCRCLCPRGEHSGYMNTGHCQACHCRHFLARLPEAEEAEARLLNMTLEKVFGAMSPVIRKV